MTTRRALPLTLLLLVATTATARAHKHALTKIPGYAQLSQAQRTLALRTMEAIPCYHGCKGSIAHCVARSADNKTAARLARYVVYLIKHKLTQEQVTQVLQRRRESVHPKQRHSIALQGAPRLGSPKAPLVIVEYADFQCRHCAALAPLMHRLVKAYKGKVALVFKVYPLRFKGPSLHAAKAALAAQRQGKFWQLAPLLFQHPEQHSPAGVERLAQKAGLDMGNFRAAMKDINLLKQLERNKIEGMRFGIKGTPTLFFNGKPHLLRKDEYHLRDRIGEELELLGERR